MTRQEAARQLGVPLSWLEAVVEIESRWNPKAKNPGTPGHESSARGLIQWIDSTARGLGYKSSLDLIQKNPTEGQQLALVVKTLSWAKPFAGETEFYLSVFSPANRKKAWQELTPLEKSMNPKIVHYADYVSFVVKKREQMEKKKKGLPSIIPVLLFGALIILTRGS